MHRWKKLGLVFDPMECEDRPDWRWAYAQGQNALLFDDFVRVYICSREKPDEKGRTKSRIGYVDLDRNNLTNVIRVSDKPVLALGKLGCFDEFGQYPFCPVRAGGKIYGYHGGVTRCESTPFNSAIGIALSEDNGETFFKLGDGPVLSYSLQEPFCIGSPKVRIFNEKWYMTYSAGRKWTQGADRTEVCYKLRMATSDDGILWEKYDHDIIEDKVAADESQACGDVFEKNGKYHMFFCYRKHDDFRKNKNNSYRIGYAWSYDMYHWTRDDARAGIHTSELMDAWDFEMIAYPNVFEVDGTIYMTYLGNEVGKHGFGLARLEGELE